MLKQIFILVLLSFHFLLSGQDNPCVIYFESNNITDTSVEIDVKANGFKDIAGYQMFIEWDSTVLLVDKVINVNPMFDELDFLFNDNLAKNAASAIWFSLSGAILSLSDSSVLFTIKYNYNGFPCDESEIQLIDQNFAQKNLITYSANDIYEKPLNSNPIIFQIPGNNCDAPIIPEERRVSWNPGISGGIPDFVGAVENVVDHGADSTGANDSREAFVNAINSVPLTGGVVFIPKGDYKISSTILIQRNNVILRGEGVEKSRLFMDFGDDSFIAAKWNKGDWQAVGAIAKGANSIEVPDGSKFIAGKFAELQQENDPIAMFTQPEWDVTWAENSVGQLFEVISVNGNTVNFKTKVHFSYSAEFNPVLRPIDLVEKVGFEDFYIEKLASGGNTFLIKNAAYCWVKNIESYHTRVCHVDFNNAIGCEIRDNYFHHSFSYGGGGSGYGVKCGNHTTDVLVENNIFNHLRHSLIISVGANGCVYGYNYAINNVQGDGETNLNQGWVPPDLSIHGHYPYMNLFEGNVINYVGIGDYWGAAGIGNTYYRNNIRGTGIHYYDNSHGQNVVGNITKKLADIDENSLDKIEHGNKINGEIIWDDNIERHQLPNSYYLNTKPEFFNNLNWPPFGPNQDEENKIPAQLRFEGNLIIADAGEDVSICLGDSAVLTASGGVSYLWSNGSTETILTVKPDTTTTYSVAVTDGIYTATDEVIVTVNELPEINIETENSEICKGQTTILSAIGGEQYIWNTGESSYTISVSESGNYSVIGSDINGCSATGEIEIIVYDLPYVTIETEIDTICEGYSTTLTASDGENYLWNTGESTKSITVSPTETTNYSVEVTDVNGCSNASDTTIIVEVCSGNINLTNTIETVSLFPNPLKDVLYLSAKGFGSKAVLQIMDSQGKVLLKSKLLTNYDESIIERIDVSEFNNGVYFLKLQNESKIETRKFMVMQ